MALPRSLHSLCARKKLQTQFTFWLSKRVRRDQFAVYSPGPQIIIASKTRAGGHRQSKKLTKGLFHIRLAFGDHDRQAETADELGQTHLVIHASFFKNVGKMGTNSVHANAQCVGGFGGCLASRNH